MSQVVAQGNLDSGSLAINNPLFQLPIPIPEGLVDGLLYVVAYLNNVSPGGQSILPAMPFEYGGQAMTVDGDMIMNVELAEAALDAWLHLGDGSDFEADAVLRVNLTNYLKPMPNASRFRLQWFIVSGIVQQDPLDEAKVVNLNETTPPTLLSVAGDPSAEGAFVSTSMGGLGSVVPSLNSPLDFTYADQPLSAYFRAHVAFKLLSTATENLSWNSTPSGFNCSRATARSWLNAPAPPQPCDESHNCECDEAEGARALGELRLELLRATGYAAQASRPPPGIAEMYNGFLDRAQKYIYSRYRSMQTERFFTWVLQDGVRYYGVKDSTSCCDTRLNRYRITGAWIEDLNGAWHPLRYGIEPRLYTMDTGVKGLPQRYEVRQCIEIFPSPIQIESVDPIEPGMPAYRLWIKGHFGLRPFWDDAHLTTIEGEAVLLHAIGMAKRHKGMPDAADYFAMADKHVKALVAGSHGTRRYIPGARDDVIFEGPPRPATPIP